jgi:S1-C subfamily serine protease
VFITTYDYENKEIGVGSGFFITPTQVVSNWHVIEDAFRAEIKTGSGQAYPVNGTLAFDQDSDLALLQIGISPDVVSPLIMSHSAPMDGERIVVVGNPLGLEGSVSDGIVSGVQELANKGRMMQITAQYPQVLVGPVVNMMGQVIGVTRGSLRLGRTLTLRFSARRCSI